MKTKVTHLLQIWVVKYMSGFCGKNYMRYKWKEVPYHGYLCHKWTEVK